MPQSDAAPSGQQPITPTKRKQLQQSFEYGNRKMTAGDYDYANTMFLQCVQGDPGNLIYAQTFVGNLRQKYGNNKKGSKMAGIKGAKAKTLIKKSEMQKHWDVVRKHAIDMLQTNPWDHSALLGLANASGEMGYEEVQVTYLRMALDGDPQDMDVNRRLGTELRARAQFDQAIVCWQRVLKKKPNDAEAKKMISDLTVEKTIAKGRYEETDLNASREGAMDEAGEPVRMTNREDELEKQISKNPADVILYIELAELFMKGMRLKKAEGVLVRGIEGTDGDPDLKERRLEVQAQLLQDELVETKESYEVSKSGHLKQKFYQLKEKLAAKTLETHLFRIERYPHNTGYRFDLGVLYQTSGRFKEAIGEFQQAKQDASKAGVCLLALGQCFQQIKQYRLALSHYEEAAEAISNQDLDRHKQALYLTAKLAAALKEFDKAEKYATQLAGIDFSYKDVSDLLDKINTNRQDNA